MKLILFLSILSLTSSAFADCVPASEKIKIPPDIEGYYNRFSPYGDYAIVSENGQSLILDLRERNVEGTNTAKVIPTKMKKEAYPVEGPWDLIASPFDEGMSYYEFKAFLRDGGQESMKVDPVFRDKNLYELYHSSAELEGSTSQAKKVRTMVWTNRRTKDYIFHYDKNGTFQKAEEVKSFNACENLVHLSKKNQDKLNKLLAERDRYSDAYYKAKAAKDEKLMEKVLVGYRRADNAYNDLEPIDTQLTNPVISKDGTRVAALVREKIRIFKIEKDTSCTLIANTGFRGSKVSFSYPEKGKEPRIVFTTDDEADKGFQNAAVIYDPNTKNAQVVSRPEDAPLYPGFNRDGRVQYKSNHEIVTIDPNQTAAVKGACIQASAKAGDEGLPVIPKEQKGTQ